MWWGREVPGVDTRAGEEKNGAVFFPSQEAGKGTNELQRTQAAAQTRFFLFLSG